MGFGDISATTDQEMLFAVLAELVGTIVFGTLVGTVGSIIGRRKMLEDRYESEVAEVKEFMESKRIPMGLQKKVSARAHTAASPRSLGGLSRAHTWDG